MELLISLILLTLISFFLGYYEGRILGLRELRKKVEENQKNMKNEFNKIYKDLEKK